MAGTIIDRKLTITRSKRAGFEIATVEDDAAIRRLLRENPMPGRIALTLEREPDYFADAHLPGIEKQTIVARESGRVIGMGSATIRRRFVNGRPCRVGYLGELRLDSSAAGRFGLVRRGYELFHQLQANKPADFYFTSIASDNHPARRALERGLPGMPKYEFVGEFVTRLLPVPRRIADRTTVESGTAPCRKIVDFVNQCGQGYQFSVFWTADELAALSALGLHDEDWQSVHDKNSVAALGSIWDQRCFKQTVIRGYSPQLARARPIANLAARFLGTSRLPDVNSALAHAFASPFAVASKDFEAMFALIRRLQGIAVGRKIEFLTLGFAADDPRLAQLRARFRGREYLSRIYVVTWPDVGGARRQLDGRCLGPEVALL